MAKPNVSTTAVALTAEYDGLNVGFTEDGWFNATIVAAKYGKLPNEWLRLPETGRYLAALERKYGTIPHSKTQRGRSGGTWLHPRLGVRFAQWLDIDFAIWCDEQISTIIEEKRNAQGVVADYLPGYHATHDRIHELANGSPNERFVHININKLVNKAAGIEAGQRASLPPGKRAIVAAAQIAASQALASATDHHDGYARAKEALSHLEQAFLPK